MSGNFVKKIKAEIVKSEPKLELQHAKLNDESTNLHDGVNY